MALHAALPQAADDVHGLLQHRPALLRARPAIAQDVLVERLAAAEPEREAPFEQDRAGRGGLRDDRRVDPHGRARDGGRDLHLRGRVRERPDHRPHARAVALRVVPRVIVVGDPQAREARVLSHPSLREQLARGILLARQEVADPHARSATRGSRRSTRFTAPRPYRAPALASALSRRLQRLASATPRR